MTSSSRKFVNNGIADSKLFLDKLQADPAGFSKLASLLKTRAGINMIANDKNKTLMASRLAYILKENQLTSYKQYLEFLAEGSPDRMTQFISALTTNTTQFFREPVHFDVLKQQMTELIHFKKSQHRHEIRIWCSAASTGQEVYTMLMVILGQLQDYKSWDIKFLATDIDPEVIARAGTGIYQENEMQGVPEIYRQQFFNCIEVKSPKRYQVKKEVRDLVRFATFNLLTEKYPFQHPFDIVFCRNVLIYFDRPTAEGVIEKLALSLRPGGILFLGHSETGMMRTKFLKNISSAAYKRTGDKGSL